MSERTIDARGLECPRPVLETRKALSAGGLSLLRVIVDNRAATENVSRMAGSLGWKAAVEPSGGDFTVVLTPGDAAPSPADADAAGRKVVAFIPSQFFGSGDDELGGILMRAFIKTLAELDPMPSALILANSGVRLTCEGSPLAEDIAALEAAGVTVLSCGTCLDFFGLKERLLVGGVTNMFEIASTLASADSVMRP